MPTPLSGDKLLRPVTYVSPAKDFIVREEVTPQKAELLQIGQAHENASKYPDHKLCALQPSDGGHAAFYLATREAQEEYNYQFANVISREWPTLEQTFIFLREDYVPLVAAPETGLPPTFDGAFEWTFVGEQIVEAGEIERGLFVQVVRTWQDTRAARETRLIDGDTGEIVTTQKRLVPEGTQPTKINNQGRYTDITPLSSLISVATTKQASGLAGRASFGKATRTTPLRDNYPWPPVLRTLDITPILSDPGNFASEVVGFNWRPLWLTEGFNGPCAGILRETWFAKQPAEGGDANWIMGDAWATATNFTAGDYRSHENESYKCLITHTSGTFATDLAAGKWAVVRPLMPAETPLLTRSIEFHGRDLTISNLPRCLHPRLYIQDTQFRGDYAPTIPQYWPTQVLARVRVSPDQGGWLMQEWIYYSPDATGLTPGLVLSAVSIGSRQFTLQWTPQLVASPILSLKLDVCRQADFKAGFLPGYKNKDITPGTNTPPLQTIVTNAPRGVNLYCRVTRDGVEVSNTVLVSTEPQAELAVQVNGSAVTNPSAVALSDIVQGVGRVVTVTLSNDGLLSLESLVATVSGTNASDVTVGTLPSSIAPGEEGTFTITVNPSATGARSAVVSLASSALENDPWVFNLSYTGTAPEINVKVGSTSYANGATVPMGTVGTGSEGTVTFTVENTGTGTLDLAVSLVPTVPGEFRLGDVPASVSAGSSVTFDVFFAPTAGGTRTAVLSLLNNDPTGSETPYVLNLSGTGNAVGEIEIQDPDGLVLEDGVDSFNFGTVGTVGETRVKTFTIINRGAGTLGSLAVSKSGTHQADYTLGALGSTSLAAGASTTFTITVVPSATGARTATISVASDDANENPSTFDVVTTGGTGPEIVVEYPPGTSLVSGSAAVDFGGVEVDGETAVLTFTLKNIGQSTLSGIALSFTGTHAAEFTASAVSSTLGIDASTTFQVTFNPAGYALRSATLNIANNDSDENPFTVALSGNGIAANGLVTFQPASVVVGQADFDDANGPASTSRLVTANGCAINSRGWLAISDRSAHVVRIWQTMPLVNGRACDVTLGTAGTYGVSATLLNSPAALAWDGDDLLVCDTGNNRVLRFVNPSSNGQAASNVIGQTSFTNSGSAVTQSRLNSPSGVTCYLGKLLVADTQNNRVLGWNTMPTGNGTNANFVIGQSSFTNKVTGTAANRLNKPLGLTVSPVSGKLYVADTDNSRVCVWNAVPTASNTSANRVLGLPAFGLVAPGAADTTLNGPYDVAVNAAGCLAISYIRAVKLWYEEPTTNGAAAHAVIGQPDFSTYYEYGNVSSTISDKGFFYATEGLDWYGSDLAVTDTDTGRALIFKPA